VAGEILHAKSGQGLSGKPSTAFPRLANECLYIVSISLLLTGQIGAVDQCSDRQLGDIGLYAKETRLVGVAETGNGVQAERPDLGEIARVGIALSTTDDNTELCAVKPVRPLLARCSVLSPTGVVVDFSIRHLFSKAKGAAHYLRLLIGSGECWLLFDCYLLEDDYDLVATYDGISNMALCIGDRIFEQHLAIGTHSEQCPVPSTTAFVVCDGEEAVSP
jgi:hypothetical protein